jgi:hypothetical protein
MATYKGLLINFTPLNQSWESCLAPAPNIFSGLTCTHIYYAASTRKA